MPAPTSEDAHIYLQLLEISQQPHFIEARRWVGHEMEATTFKELEDKYPTGSEGRARVVAVLGFYESIGVLVSRGLLHEDLFFDSPLGMEHIWQRFEGLVTDWQKSADDESVWENLIWLGHRYPAWRDSSWRPKSEAIPTDRPPTKQWGDTQGHVGFTKS